MSLAIDVDKVAEVLLADGTWHKVAGASFGLDAYEYMHAGRAVFSGGSVAGVVSTGATWTEPGGARFCCPVTSILAVKLVTKSEPGRPTIHTVPASPRRS